MSAISGRIVFASVITTFYRDRNVTTWNVTTWDTLYLLGIESNAMGRQISRIPTWNSPHRFTGMYHNPIFLGTEHFDSVVAHLEVRVCRVLRFELLDRLSQRGVHCQLG